MVTSITAGLMAAAGLVAVVDWVALAGDRRSVGLVTKPAVILLLLAAALAVTPINPQQRTFFVAALALSAAGDAALLASPRWFVVGLGAFLLAHLAYIGGLLQVRGSGESVAAGVVFVVLAGIFMGIPIVLGAARKRGVALGVAVVAYLATISAMVVVAGQTDLILARVGAVLLYASDGVLGWNRFVTPIRQGRLLTRIPYHLGQGLMVLSLVFSG
jgi:uncharacterized membrane protein YhhN